ncbi:hypothetical protein D1P53_000465 [Cryptococcus gattii VGV]|nr:hypothetical protein D1P53_000465 [Cryptococcus gattii VGV]
MGPILTKKAKAKALAKATATRKAGYPDQIFKYYIWKPDDEKDGLKTDESPIGGKLQEDITEKNTIASSPPDKVARVLYKNGFAEVPFYRPEVVPGRTHKQLFASRFIHRSKTFIREPHLVILSDGFTAKKAEEAYASCTPDIKARISALANARSELGGSRGG